MSYVVDTTINSVQVTDRSSACSLIPTRCARYVIVDVEPSGTATKEFVFGLSYPTELRASNPKPSTHEFVYMMAKSPHIRLPQTTTPK